jgi:hypothetical protein
MSDPDVCFDPLDQLFSGNSSGGQTEELCLLLVYTDCDLRSVQHQEDFHGGMADSLVPVDERVVHDERVREGCSLRVQQRSRSSKVIVG